MSRLSLLFAAIALMGCGVHASSTSSSSLQSDKSATHSQLDSDNDGLTDEFETTVTKSDPRSRDTDGDGLADGEELTRKCSPTQKDSDGDGLSDGDELNVHRTSPILRDTDGDGLTDGDEILELRTKPLAADTDDDGVPDGIDKCPLEPGAEMHQGCLGEF